MESRQIELSTGARVFVATEGRGSELVVFLHAVGSDHTMWQQQMEALDGDRYTLVAYDLRGHGGSKFDVENTMVRDAISISGFAKDTLALIDLLGFQRAHLAGISMGGAVALEVFKRRSDVVQSLTLANAAAFYPNGGVFEGIEDVRTHDPVERRDYVEFLNSTCGYEPSEYYKQLRDFSTPALDFLNVRYLVASELEKPPSEKWKPVYSGRDGTVFENARVLPRLFSPRKIRRAQPGDAAWPSGDDWSEEALVRFKGTMPAA